MMKERVFHAISYFSVATIAVCLAFLIALRFVPRSHSQTTATPPPKPPPAGDAVATPGASAAPVDKSPTAAGDSAKAVLEEVTGFLEPFIYDAKSRRDPFQPYVEIRSASAMTVPSYLSPLQRYELSEFKLVGIMWDVHDPKAMFIDPDHQVHVVGRDESIGKKNGYIAAIREGEVVVVESNRARDGLLTYKPTVLRIER